MVTFGPSTKIYEDHDQYLDAKDEHLVSREIASASKLKSILKRTTTAQNQETATFPTSRNIPEIETGNTWTHLLPVPTVNEAYHELSEFHVPQAMWGKSMDDMLSHPDARAWLNLTSRVGYQRDGFKAITAPNTTSILENIVADIIEMDKIEGIERQGWSCWPVRSYEVVVAVTGGQREKATGKSEGQGGYKEEEIKGDSGKERDRKEG